MAKRIRRRFRIARLDWESLLFWLLIAAVLWGIAKACTTLGPIVLPTSLHP